MNNFPYPVLLDEDSSYLDEYTFKIDYINHQLIAGDINFSININLNSITLINLINNKQAKIIIKITSDITTKIIECVSINVAANVLISIGDAKKNDTISITCIIVSCESKEIGFNKEIKPIYGEGFTSKIRKGDILAISNVIKFDIITNNLDFIKLSVDQSLQRGYKIRLNRNEYIEVSISNEMNHAYSLIKRNGKKLDSLRIFNSNLIFEAITYILLELINDYDNYKEYEWCRQFKLVTNSIDVDLEEFIAENIESDQKNENIYDLAHLIIKNQIEKTLVKASKSESEN